MKTTLENTLAKADSTRNEIHAEWLKAVQGIADRFQVEIATGHLSDTWQVNSGLGKDDFRALYDDEGNEALLALEELDEKTQDYGVGPSNMERFRPNPPLSEYDTQAETFLAKHGLKFRATLSDSKTPAWEDEGREQRPRRHYRVTLSRSEAKQCRNPRLVFDFWGSIADCECQQCKGKKTVKLDKPEPIQVPNPKAGTITKEEYGAIDGYGKRKNPKHWNYTQPPTLAAWKRDTTCPRCNGSGTDPEPVHPKAYSVLACISSDAYTPETFADFCAEYGYESDSIKALQMFRRCDAFAKRLRAFFTASELDDLSQIS